MTIKIDKLHGSVVRIIVQKAGETDKRTLMFERDVIAYVSELLV